MSEVQRDDVAMTGGVPATGAGALVDLIAADPPVAVKSAFTDLLEQQLAAPKVHRTRVQEWVEEPHTRQGGRWVDVS